MPKKQEPHNNDPVQAITVTLAIGGRVKKIGNGSHDRGRIGRIIELNGVLSRARVHWTMGKKGDDIDFTNWSNIENLLPMQ